MNFNKNKLFPQYDSLALVYRGNEVPENYSFSKNDGSYFVDLDFISEVMQWFGQLSLKKN